MKPCREESCLFLVSQMDGCRSHTAHRLLPFQQPLQPALGQCSLQHVQKTQVPPVKPERGRKLPDPEFRSLLPHCTKLPQRKHTGQLLYYCWQAPKFAQNLYK